MDDLPVWKRNLPKTPHKLLNDVVTLLVNFYLEHIERDTSAGRLKPSESWTLLRGLLLAAMQTYASICLLLADRRPKRLMLQAGVLNRLLFEIFATACGILEDPGNRQLVFRREAHKAWAARYQYLDRRWGREEDWQEYLGLYRRGLITVGATLGLSADDALRPASISDEWPTPGGMIYGRPARNVPPFVSGGRREVLREIYEYHYSYQSAQAHGRVAAIALAMLVDQPQHQWNPGYGESDIVVTAMLVIACLLTELQDAGTFSRHPKLSELWTYLRDLDDEAKDLWSLRYEALQNAAP